MNRGDRKSVRKPVPESAIFGYRRKSAVHVDLHVMLSIVTFYVMPFLSVFSFILGLRQDHPP